MSRETKSKYAILGMLSMGPMSGYDIKKRMEATINFFWNESYGQIYPLLKEIVAEELAQVETEKNPGKPERYVYALTDKGRVVLQGWLEEPTELTKYRNELLLKLYFGHQVIPEISIEMIEKFQAETLELGQKFEEIEQRMKGLLKEEGEYSPLFYSYLTTRHGRYMVQARLDWCRETLERLKELAQAKKQE